MLLMCCNNNLAGKANTSHTYAQNKRHLYSVLSFFIQYAIPLLTISLCYGFVYRYLQKHRMIRSNNQSDLQKVRRTNRMLLAISLFFVVCWSPLNIFNVVVDATNIFQVLNR